MNLNVFSWPYRKSYYLIHPWKWFKHLFQNLRAAYRRIKFGWCYTDVWELGYWLLEILPPMFEYLAANGYGFPGDEEFPTYESWQQWLLKIAQDIRSVQEENVEKQNEYDEEFHHTHNEEIGKKYFQRMIELDKWREEKMVEIFSELARKIPALWD